jgi:hypothetical protein
MEHPIEAEIEKSRSRSPRLRRIAISIACFGIGIVGGLLVFVLTTIRQQPPRMTAADFQAAVARWRANRPENYEMRIEVSGRQGGSMQVVVSNFQPLSVKRNGQLVPARTWTYWTVDGLFEVIRTDLEGLDQPERAFGEEDVSQLVQQAEFDEALGYPRRYRRAVMTTGDSIEWEITALEVN